MDTILCIGFFLLGFVVSGFTVRLLYKRRCAAIDSALKQVGAEAAMLRREVHILASDEQPGATVLKMRYKMGQDIDNVLMYGD
jgi:Tfp pilus assembly protein PilX